MHRVSGYAPITSGTSNGRLDTRIRQPNATQTHLGRDAHSVVVFVRPASACWVSVRPILLYSVTTGAA